MVENAYIEQIRSLDAGKLPKYDLEYLEKTCNEFPCFHSAFVLKAIYKKQANEVAFQEELPSFAVRVLNRSVLYDRVHASFSSDVLLPKEKVVDEELKGVLEEAAQLQQEPREELVEEVISTPEEDLKELVDSIQKKQEQHPIVSKVTKTKKKKTPKKPTKIKKTPKLEKKDKEVIINSFTDWLKHKNATGKQKAIVEKKPIIREDVSEERVPIDMVASNEAELILEAKRSSFKLEDFLVDQIERKQQQKEQAGSQNLFGISETYAKILTDQGKIQEAIKVYKELSIKYPKKSSNFARQIDNLKNSL